MSNYKIPEKELLELKRNLTDRKVLFSISGYVSQGVLEKIIPSLEHCLKNEEKKGGEIFKIIYTFIESSQNITNYQNSKKYSPFYKDIKESVMLILEKEEDVYRVVCQNFVINNEVKEIETILSEIKTFTPKELKAMYMKKINEAIDFESEGQGAGLGFIDMFRKSKRFDYSIEEYNENLSVITLSITV